MLAREPDVELLLLDINMPVMDGLTLLSELRTRQSPVRAIIVSAYGDMANLRTAMNRGAFDFVTKPVDLNDLEITMRKTLDEIARIREIDQRRAAAERARVNLSRYFSPNMVEIAGRTRRAIGRGSAPDRRRAVRRYRRVHADGRGDAARGGRDDAARLSRADDGADLCLRRHGREIYRRRDFRGIRGAERNCGGPAQRVALRREYARGAARVERRARSASANRRSTSASVLITARPCSAMSAANTACPSPSLANGQHRGSLAGSDPGAEYAAGRQRCIGRGDPGAAPRQRRRPARPVARGRRADTARPRRPCPYLDRRTCP